MTAENLDPFQVSELGFSSETEHYSHCRETSRPDGNGSVIMPLDSPGGSTLQWVWGEICCALHRLFIFDLL